MRTKFYLLAIALVLTGLLRAQEFYDVNTINEIEITFEQDNWDEILDAFVAAGDEERLTGRVTINGQLFDSVGVRYKGNSSYSPDRVKNPLNIKLDYILGDQLLQGYGTLKLANVYKDPSFVREVLSYEIARQYMPAGLSNFARVTINGTYLGLYTSDQDVDKFFMRTHFNSDENARIKGEISSTAPPGQMGGVWQWAGSDSSLYFDRYALESDFGWNELVEFLDTLNNYNDQTDQVLNIDSHLWFLAFSNLLVNLDGPINNPQNYYLYQDDGGRFNPIPWDLNESFGVFTMLQTIGPLGPVQLQQLDPLVNLSEPDYPVIAKVLNNDRYQKQYFAHMRTMMDECMANGWYYDRIMELQAIIDEEVQNDPNKFYTYADFINNVNSSIGVGPMAVIGLTQLMDARVNYLSSLSYFQAQPPQISQLSYSPEPVVAGTEVWFSATVSDASFVELCTRHGNGLPFVHHQMFDDGNHHDGLAGDGVYGVMLTAGHVGFDYYAYAENSDAGAFLPARAAHETFRLSVNGDLVINEFMADNENTVADQDGEYDDWIELYNNSDAAIALGGYHLSDDATDPGQWTFPDTTVAAGGYLIIWADDDTGQQGLHANFKISASGETLVLSDDNMVLLDEVSFGAQLPDTTTGRYPNGTGDFVIMMPTFGYENNNILTVVTYTNAAPPVLDQNVPNPVQQQTTITFHLPGQCDVLLQVIDSRGVVVDNLAQGTMNAGDYSYRWDASTVSPGLYLCMLRAGQHRMVKKIIVQ